MFRVRGTVGALVVAVGITGCGGGGHRVSDADFAASAQAACLQVARALPGPRTPSAGPDAALSRLADAASAVARVAAPAGAARWDDYAGALGRQLTALTSYRTALDRGQRATQQRLLEHALSLDAAARSAASRLGVTACGVPFVVAYARAPRPVTEDQLAVANVYVTYQTALWRRHGERACRLLTVGARIRLARLARSAGGRLTCAAAMRLASRELHRTVALAVGGRAAQERAFGASMSPDGWQTRIRVTGDRAAASPLGTRVPFVRTSHGWRVDAFRTPPAAHPASPSERAFVTAAGRICMRSQGPLDRAFAPAAPHTSSARQMQTHRAAVVRGLTQTVRVAGAEINALAALPVPPRLARPWSAYLAVNQQQLTAFARAAVLLRHGDAAAAARSFGLAEALDSNAVSAARASAVTECM